MLCPPQLCIYPPLLNTACPWATSRSDVLGLLACPSSGAVTTRTASVPHAFPQDDTVHRAVFFDSLEPSASVVCAAEDAGTSDVPTSSVRMGSLNSYGYSPLSFDEYLGLVSDLSAPSSSNPYKKTFIISITGSPSHVSVACTEVARLAACLPEQRLAVEINLSCPNIPDAPPPAYSSAGIMEYLRALPAAPTLPMGIKLPPYSHGGQFIEVIEALRPFGQRVSFVTATNTLGGCLLFIDPSNQPQHSGQTALPVDGLGGMAGAPLHLLSLGNVSTLRRLMDSCPQLAHVSIIGVGGVSNGRGYRRMRHAGANYVGIATALGVDGTQVFTNISTHVGTQW